MKDVFKFSVMLNTILLCTTFLLFNKYYDLKKESAYLKKKLELKIDSVYIYNSHEFSCDSGYTSLEINLCSL